MTYATSPIDGRFIEPSWRPIHYLGSKLRAVPHLIETILDLRRPDTAVCDLFAGSGTVSNSLANECQTVAADIQEYSRVICSALLLPTQHGPQSSTELIADRSLRNDLMNACEPLLEYERSALLDLLTGDTTAMASLQLAAPLQLAKLSVAESKVGRAAAATKDRLRSYSLDQGAQTVVLRQFGASYFSIQQSIDLCALLDAARDSGPRRDRQIAAVLSVASEIVNSVGKQFAQPLKLTNASGDPKPYLATKVQRDKTVDVLKSYDIWIERYSRQRTPTFSHRAVRSDYVDTLHEHSSDVSVVYADPPYGREHYSRYYHVLETMAIGDDPQISLQTSKRSSNWSTGAYRQDRHQSPFCIKSKAPEAFRSLFAGVKDISASLVLSYSPTAEGEKPRHRVMPLDILVSIARDFFSTVELSTISNIEHIKLNKVSLNSRAPTGSEILIVCHD